MQPTSEQSADTYQSEPVRDSRTVAEAVVRAVADVENCAPEALPPLTEAVDPDALNVVASSDDTDHVSFAYADHDVVVSSLSDVVVD